MKRLKQQFIAEMASHEERIETFCNTTGVKDYDVSRYTQIGGELSDKMARAIFSCWTDTGTLERLWTAHMDDLKDRYGVVFPIELKEGK